MEGLQLKLDDGTGNDFDEALKDTLPDGGDLQIITKKNATAGGNTAVMLTFSVELPSGELARVQTVTTARLFLNATRLIEAAE